MDFLRAIRDYVDLDSAEAKLARRNRLCRVIQRSAGISREIAKRLAFDCFRDWDESDLSSALGRVVVGFGSLGQLQIVDRRDERHLTRPSDDLISQAATTRKALCINKLYQFQLRDDGYMAISHVWAEGLHADPFNNGLPRSVIDQVFTLLKGVNGAEWLWLDSLAVPGGTQDINAETSRIKTKLINNMCKIYRNAEAVIILDALIMHLQSSLSVHVGVALLCGNWSRRMWTFQESRLASKVIVITGRGPVDLHSVILDLSHQDQRGIKWMTGHLRAIFNPRKDVTLLELSKACSLREAGMDIDHIRALYPVLSLPWEQKYDRDKAMEVVYQARKFEALQLAWTWGCPRLRGSPGWAPSYLSGIESHELKDAILVGDGLQVSLYQYPIHRAVRSPQERFSLRIEFAQKEIDGTPFSCLVRLSPKECNDELVPSKFLQVANNGDGMLLAHAPLPVTSLGDEETRIVVLAGAVHGEPGRFDVYLSVKICHLEKAIVGTKAPCVLSDMSPLKEDGVEGDVEQMRKNLITLSSITQAGGTKLHEAVRKANEKWTKSLLDAGEDPNAKDATGWCPLHWAIYASSKSSLCMIELLVNKGAKPYGGGSQSKTAATLAAERGSDDVVKYLIRQKIDHKPQQGLTPLIQALYSQRKAPIILHLIDTGADLLQLVYGRPPLYYALSNHGTLDLLLRNGADPSARLADGRSLLHVAARDDNDQAIVRIITSGGVSVDMKQIGGSERTALHDAVISQSFNCVNTLLRLSADPNQQCGDGRTALHFAIAKKNKDIVTSLLRWHAKVSLANDEGQTALQFAVSYGHLEILTLLLEAADSAKAIWQQDVEGLTPYARSAQQTTSDNQNQVTLLLVRRMEGMSKLYVTTFAFVYLEGFCFIAWQILNLYIGCMKLLGAFLDGKAPDSFIDSLRPSAQALILILMATATVIWFARVLPIRTLQALLRQSSQTHWQNKAGTQPAGEEPSLIMPCAVAYTVLPLYYYIALKLQYGSSVATTAIRLLLTEMPLHYLLESLLGFPKPRAISKTGGVLTMIWKGDALLFGLSNALFGLLNAVPPALHEPHLNVANTFVEVSSAELMQSTLLACIMTALVYCPGFLPDPFPSLSACFTFLGFWCLLIVPCTNNLNYYLVNVFLSLIAVFVLCSVFNLCNLMPSWMNNDKSTDRRVREVSIWIWVGMLQLFVALLFGRSIGILLNVIGLGLVLVLVLLILGLAWTFNRGEELYWPLWIFLMFCKGLLYLSGLPAWLILKDWFR